MYLFIVIKMSSLLHTYRPQTVIHPIVRTLLERHPEMFEAVFLYFNMEKSIVMKIIAKLLIIF